MLGESGADASMEEIAARAGVGMGTVYRRFANKDALIDELVRLSLGEARAAAKLALACPGGDGHRAGPKIHIDPRSTFRDPG